jgi:hypothetical protein
MAENTINHIFFPRTEPPPEFTDALVSVFEGHLAEIGTLGQEDGLRSDEVFSLLEWFGLFSVVLEQLFAVPH